MDYRVYKDSGKGYKYINTYQLDDIMFLLDLCILEQKTNDKILVIWHDYAMNCDSPFYLHSGNTGNAINEYIAFRNTILSDNMEHKLLL